MIVLEAKENERKRYPIYFSHFKSCKEIYIQFADNKAQLEELNEQIKMVMIL
jgi:hypothetical protein